MPASIRFALLIVGLLIVAVAVAAHGAVRTLSVLVVVTLLVTVPRTRIWKTGERWLVGLTGSRRRAAVLAMCVVIGVLAAVNIYNLAH